MIARFALQPLAGVIAGDVVKGQLRGSYQGHPVEAWAARVRPQVQPTDPSDYDVGPETRTFSVRLGGLRGFHHWDCRSFPAGLAAGTASEVLANWGLGKLVYPRVAKEFRFVSGPFGKRLGNKLGVSFGEDPALSARLRDAGLFGELTQLRWGPNPYLPKASFSPGLEAVSGAPAGSWAAQLSMPGLLESARRSGKLSPDKLDALETGLAARMQAISEQPPGGRLVVEVEMRGARVPDVTRFADLLAAMLRIAQLNAEVNVAGATGG